PTSRPGNGPRSAASSLSPSPAGWITWAAAAWANSTSSACRSAITTASPASTSGGPAPSAPGGGPTAPNTHSPPKPSPPLTPPPPRGRRQSRGGGRGGRLEEPLRGEGAHHRTADRRGPARRRRGRLGDRSRGRRGEARTLLGEDAQRRLGGARPGVEPRP